MFDNNTRIAVTGTGLVCPAEINVAESWDFFLTGKSAARKCEKLEGLEIDYACCIPNFDRDKFLGRMLAPMI